MIEIILATALNYNIYTHIDNLRKLPRTYRNNIISKINKYSTLYKIPKPELLCIMYVESNFKLNAENKQSNDHGIMQVNEYNIKHYNLSKRKLKSNLDYSVKWGSYIASFFYHRYNDGTLKWVGKYNCGTKPDCELKTNYISKIDKCLKKGNMEIK